MAAKAQLTLEACSHQHEKPQNIHIIKDTKHKLLLSYPSPWQYDGEATAAVQAFGIWQWPGNI
jgi:hypothetical protein